MVTLDSYTKDILVQIMSSHDTLTSLKDRPGDLDVINREWLRLSALLHSLVDRIDSSGVQTDLYVTMLKAARRYLEDYYFAREIETMMDLYSEDPNRLKNMRLKVIESLHDKKFIQHVEEAISEL